MLKRLEEISEMKRMAQCKIIELQVHMIRRITSFSRAIVQEEKGMGMVEIALIIIIIIALGLTFKKAINDFLESIFANFDITGYK